MEFIPKTELLEFNPDTLEVVRKMYNFEQIKELDEAINILDTWVKQQNHFVKKDFSRGYLERMIISAKGSIEKAKYRMEKLCTMKTLIPYLFEDVNVKEYFKNGDDGHIFQACLPRLTRNHERVHVVRMSSKTGTTQKFLEGFKQCALIAEYIKAHDYAASYIIIGDMRDCNIPNFLTQVGVMDFKNTMTAITEGYGVRLTGIHILSNLKFLDALLTLLRQVFSKKIGERIHVHRSLESLYEFAPKEVLPKDYGGDDSRTFDKIHEHWLEVLSSEKEREYFRSMFKACTNEKLRPRDSFNEQHMGMPGTFRTLTVD